MNPRQSAITSSAGRVFGMEVTLDMVRNGIEDLRQEISKDIAVTTDSVTFFRSLRLRREVRF